MPPHTPPRIGASVGWTADRVRIKQMKKVAICTTAHWPDLREAHYLSQYAPEHAVNPLVSEKRPEKFGIGITSKMRIVQLQGDTVIRAGTFTRAQFWKDGQPM